VLAFTVMISSVVALTLCPMLASRLIKRRDMSAESVRSTRPGAFRGGGGLSRVYCPAAAQGAGCASGGHRHRFHGGGPRWRCFRTIPQELTPPEDRAVALIRSPRRRGSAWITPAPR
jgi:HAE1 family hydrophobic/amphiphilic exporter-1